MAVITAIGRRGALVGGDLARGDELGGTWAPGAVGTSDLRRDWRLMGQGVQPKSSGVGGIEPVFALFVDSV
ncbi:uncharacterized protein SPSK_00965 [Sporothrix schenckii 1099-18]|uniref:Uncharacterized protein n=1 Tax=Sporothrix schenckii 1099-18 TaxID=1397361 RepID=A0A0F2LW58_SPOSC|nr:uncharacterized protein SPSK_00965 [Sporothrix schenckii 1099-18]KJR81707.1 hypothetical protein SPSK_00965 [Sporothrix schenckii 1099-18]